MAESLSRVNKTAELEVKKQLLLNMADVIQCFVCKMPPSTLTIQYLRCTTSKQHLICSLCRTAGKFCCTYASYYETSALIAKLMKEIGLVICRNKNNGCQEVKSHDEMIEHEEECQFRLVHCVESFCNQKIVFLDYLSTYNKRHPFHTERTGNLQKFSLLLGENTFFPTTYVIKGLTFTFVHKILTKNQIVHFWCYFIGSPKEANHFQYELNIKKDAENEIKFAGKVRSVNEDFKDFLESEDVFEMSLGMAKKYMKKSHLEYTFNVRNLKEEAKDEDFESGIDDSD